MKRIKLFILVLLPLLFVTSCNQNETSDSLDDNSLPNVSESNVESNDSSSFSEIDNSSEKESLSPSDNTVELPWI